MAGFFDYIPIIGIILFAAGIIGAMVYERVRTKNIEESSS
jgi:predicted outer membrane lipoprotein